MMKYKTYIFILFVLVANINLAQDSAFVRTYGGVNMDIARDVKETKDKGFVVAGTTSSFGQGNTSMYLVKTDSMGRHQWSKNYGGLYSDWAYAVERTLDNGYLLCGYSNSFSADYDPFVVKTDSAGNLLWQKSYPGNDWDFIYECISLPDSGFILCGETYTNSLGGSDGLVMRIDKAGNLLWTKNVGTTTDDKLYKIILLNNTLYAVGSSIQGTHKYGMLVKLNFSGNALPIITFNYNPNANQEMLCITHNSVDELIMGGYINPDGINDINDWLLKTDTMGNVIFNYSGAAGTNGLKKHEDILCIDNDEIITTGTSNGGNGGLGLFMVRYNSAGIYIAADNFGGVNNEYGYGVTLTNNKHLAFVGSTETNNFTCGDQDMYFVMNRNQHFVPNSKLNNKYFCDTLGLAVVDLKEVEQGEDDINIFPNPFTNGFEIKIPENMKGSRLIIRDLLGKIVFQNLISESKIELFNVISQNGIYFCEINRNNVILFRSKIVCQQ